MTSVAARAAAAPAPAEAVEVTAEDSEDAGTVVGSVDATLSVPASFARRSEEAPVETSEGKALATPAVRRIAKGSASTSMSSRALDVAAG